MSSSSRSIISLLRKSRSARLTPFFSNFSSQIPTKQHSRHFIPFKKLPQSYFPSISPPSSSSSSSFSKNGFIGWYLRMIETRPVLTKSVTASAIFTAADVTSQMITLTSSDSFDPIRTLRMAGYGLLISGPSLHLWFNFVSRILPKRDLSNTMKKLFLGQTTFGPIMTAVFFSVNAGLQVNNWQLWIHNFLGLVPALEIVDSQAGSLDRFLPYLYSFRTIVGYLINFVNVVGYHVERLGSIEWALDNGSILASVFLIPYIPSVSENGLEIVARLKRDMIPTLINGLLYWPLCDFVTFKFIPVRLQPLVSNSFSFLWTIYITYMASLKKADVNKISAD